MSIYKDRSFKKRLRESLLDRCKEFGIEAPENARISKLNNLLDEYLREAVVVKTTDGYDFRRTDEPVKEYTFDLTIQSRLSVIATSEDVAREWLEDRCDWLFMESNSGIDVVDCYVAYCELDAEDEV